MNEQVQEYQDRLKVIEDELRTTNQKITTAARERFPEELAGKIGHKLTRYMIDGLDALYAIVDLLESLAVKAAKAALSGETGPSQPLSLSKLALRNAGFFVLVLAHGLRRLLPPY